MKIILLETTEGCEAGAIGELTGMVDFDYRGRLVVEAAVGERRINLWTHEYVEIRPLDESYRRETLRKLIRQAPLTDLFQAMAAHGLEPADNPVDQLVEALL